MSKKLLTLFCVFFLAGYAFSQVVPDVIVFKKDSTIVDSLKTAEYPYVFPVWGQKVQEKGIQLPLPAGLGVNYVWQESDIIISNLNVGFNGQPPVNLDEVIRFDLATATLNGINIRPDLFVLPFLNVYGIVSFGKTATDIEAALSLPDSSNNWREITTISATANFDVWTLGFGLTPTVGVGGGWIALDMNFAWTDVPALSKPAFSFVFGPRLGKNIKIGLNGDRQVSFWVGGFRLKISGETEGQMNLSEVVDLNELEFRVEQGLIRVDEGQKEVDTWWGGLTPVEQRNPANIARLEVANRAIGKFGTILNNLDGALSNAETATVEYTMDKRQKDLWNFVTGVQLQFNRSWMIRGEYGFLGSRSQFIGGIQYRFGI
jgi:hypothetical protein